MSENNDVGTIKNDEPSGDSPMIASINEYEKAQQELHGLESRLAKLQQDHPIGSKGFTKAGIRKMIARLQEELAMYEGSEEARMPESK
jgi:CHASE3 domain sensor protein